MHYEMHSASRQCSRARVRFGLHSVFFSTKRTSSYASVSMFATALHAISSKLTAVQCASDTGRWYRHTARVSRVRGCGTSVRLVTVHGVILAIQGDGVGMLPADADAVNRVQSIQCNIRKVSHLGIVIAEHMHNGTCVIGDCSRPQFAKHTNRRLAYSPMWIRELLHECAGMLKKRTIIQLAQCIPHCMMAHGPVSVTEP